MRIEHIMTKPVVTCRAEDDLDSAARLMWEHDVGALPVVSQDGKLCGMITDRDICMAAYTQGRALDTIPVRCAMATQVHACVAERLMSEHQVHRVPIVDEDDAPIGLLSLNDIARSAKAGEKAGAERAILDTLAAICQPRQEANASSSREEPSRRAVA